MDDPTPRLQLYTANFNVNRTPLSVPVVPIGAQFHFSITHTAWTPHKAQRDITN